jgi:hypothetical protein
MPRTYKTAPRAPPDLPLGALVRSMNSGPRFTVVAVRTGRAYSASGRSVKLSDLRLEPEGDGLTAKAGAPEKESE